MSYGFKLFELHATEGPRNRTRLDLGDDGLLDGEATPSGWKWATVHGKTLRKRPSVLTGRPNINHPDDWEEATPTKGAPQLRITKVTKGKHGTHVFMTMRYGFYGEFDSAMGSSSEDDVDLADKSPSDVYRALLVFPPTGHEGRLAVETINQRCPVDVLLSWLAWTAYKDANGGRWSRLRVKPLFDWRKLRAMAKEAEKFEAVFTRTDPKSPDGRADDIILRHKVSSTIRQKKVIDEVGDWFKRVSGDDDEGVGDYVGRLEDIMGLDSEELHKGGLHFDDAKIVVRHQGETKTFNPESLNKVFVYQVSKDLQVDDATWRKRVYDKLTGPLSEGTDIQL